MAIPMARQNQMLKQLHSPHLPENRTDASSIVLWPPPTTGQHLIGCYLLKTDWCPFLFFLVCHKPFVSLFYFLFDSSEAWFYLESSKAVPCIVVCGKADWSGKGIEWWKYPRGVFQRSLFLGVLWHTVLLAALFNLVDVVWYTANLILLENSTGSPKWTRAMSFCRREASYLNKMHYWTQIT